MLRCAVIALLQRLCQRLISANLVCVLMYVFNIGALFCFYRVPNKCLFDWFCKLMVRFVWVVYEGAGYLIAQERHPRSDCMDAGGRATQESKPSGDP